MLLASVPDHELAQLYALMISNTARQALVCQQNISSEGDSGIRPALWDYHVIALSQHQVWDFSTLLDFGVDLQSTYGVSLSQLWLNHAQPTCVPPGQAISSPSLRPSSDRASVCVRLRSMHLVSRIRAQQLPPHTSS